MIESEQYSRRENLIISGIPESIKQERLELKVLEILETIDCRLIESKQCRENLIISGIPESIKQERLELKVLEILETIGLSITSYRNRGMPSS